MIVFKEASQTSMTHGTNNHLPLVYGKDVLTASLPIMLDFAKRLMMAKQPKGKRKLTFQLIKNQWRVVA